MAIDKDAYFPRLVSRGFLCKHKNLHIANKKVCKYNANINICIIFALSNKQISQTIKIKDYETERY